MTDKVYIPAKCCMNGVLFNWDEGYEGKNLKAVRDSSGNEWKVDAGAGPFITRFKFVNLILTNPFFFPLIRMPLRLIGLFKGDFIDHGHSVAKVKWLNNLEHKKKNSNTLLNARVRVEIAKALLKEVLKITTLFIEVILLEAAALWGLVFPYDGRKMYAAIEDFYSRPRYHGYHPAKFLILVFDEYSAPCMQPKARFDRKNLYKMNEFNTCDDQYKLKACNRLRRYSLFFNDLGIDSDKVISEIKQKIKSNQYKSFYLKVKEVFNRAVIDPMGIAAEKIDLFANL
jgi:hypothetical protein